MTGVPEVVVVPTGTANLASVTAGLRRAGAEPSLAETADDVWSARRVVLPGVGAFGAAMGRLQDAGFEEVVADRIRQGSPTLAICLGLQLLCEWSDESPGVRGLGIVPGRLERFADGVRVPQFGWNRVEPEPGSRFLAAGFAYFANSYRLAEPPAGWSAAFAEHGGRFVAAMERDGVLACQFHPELSGAWGLELLRRWLSC